MENNTKTEKKLKGVYVHGRYKPAHGRPRKRADRTGKPVGRPSLYKPEFCQTVYLLRMGGFAIEKIAERLSVDPKRIYEWREKYPEFRKNFDKGSTDLIDGAINTGTKKMLGFHEYEEREEYDAKEKITKKVRTKKYLPPDTEILHSYLKKHVPAFQDASREDDKGSFLIEVRSLRSYAGSQAFPSREVELQADDECLPGDSED